MFSVTIREKSGQVYTFHFDKPEVMIGRVKGNDVILPKQNISKRHSLVRVHAAGRFVIEDLASTNGTYVNGHRIASPVEISSDDKVYLGDFVMQFFDLGEAMQADSDQAAGADDVPAVPEQADAEPAQEVEPLLEVDSFAHIEPLPDEGPPAADFDDDLMAGVAPAIPMPAFSDPATAMDAGDLLDGVLDEATSANLDSDAAVARMMAERSRRIGELDTDAHAADDLLSDLGPGVAAPDPEAAMEALDPYRMTGPVHRLDDVLGEAASAVPGLIAPARQAAPLATEPAPASANESASAEHFETLLAAYERARSELADDLPSDAAGLSDDEWRNLESHVVAFVDRELTAERVPRTLDVARLKRDLIYELAGLGPLEEMLDDPSIHTIEVNGPDLLFISRMGQRSEAGTRFSGQQALSAAVDRLIRATGVVVDDQATHAEGSLADGTAVRVIWPPLCPSGPVVLLRKPRAEAATLADLVAQGRVTAAAATRLAQLQAEGRSVAICGWPGAGRRTLLNALALELGSEARVVVVEEGVRLHLDQPQVIRLDGTAATPGATSLVALASRLRPEHLLLGAVRAGRIVELLDYACDGIAPWIGFFHGRSIPGLLEHLVHTYAIHHPGVPAAICSARTAAVLDVVAAFSEDENGAPVLDQVVEVFTGDAGVQTRSLLDG